MTAKIKIKPGKTRVELIYSDDPYSNLKKGDKGTILAIKENKTIQVKWDNGVKLGLIPKVDKFKILTEEEHPYNPFPQEKDKEVGERNEKLYKQAEEGENISEDVPEDEKMMSDDELYNDPDVKEEDDYYKDKERRFRVSIYVDVHVPMSEDIEHDREIAEQRVSEVLKKLNHKDISNSFIGGVAHHPFASIPDDKEFDRL